LSRDYRALPRQPVTIEARCLLTDDVLLRNPHFETAAVRLERYGAPEPTQPSIALLDTTLERRDYPAWVVSGGAPLVGREWGLTEEELGVLPAAEAANKSGLPADQLTFRRSLQRYFLRARFRVDWTGRSVSGYKKYSWRPVFRTAPLLDSGLHLNVTAYPGRLQIDAPWDEPCDGANPRWVGIHAR
jgi:hypothetical protein